MDLGLKGKTAIVTGASRGIGRVIALRLAKEGMNLAVAARNEEQLRALAGEIEAMGSKALVHAADLSNAAAPAELAAAAVERFGRIDLLVNNAGATKRGDFLALTELDWADGFALKFFAAVRLARTAWPHLIAVNGSIVNIAGVGGRTGDEEFAIGGAVNAAMLNLTKCLAVRGIREGVRVNAINPGSILTERLSLRIQRLAANDGLTVDQATARMLQRHGIARFGDPEEIADAVVFLASERAAYIQGAVLDIDGGLTRTL
jgi:3-oxoacyl-[acyl-carrier protein] reductase